MQLAKPLFVEALWAPTAQRRSVLKLWLLFSAEIALFAIIRLPLDLNFNAYAFADRGSFLTVCYLAAHGALPAIDFGYPYGLLAVLFGQVWFHFFGLTPQADELAMLACALAGAWGMARFTSASGLGVMGVTFIAVALPFAILPSYLSLVYALEASILCNALAEHASGRRANALALATAACLVKPSMGYAYGLVLLLLIANEIWRSAGELSFWRRALKSVAPAVVTGTALMAAVAAIYGLPSLAGTLLPTSGRAFYKYSGYGSIFWSGRGLWYQPSAGIPFYLLTVAGFWIAATLWLTGSGLRAGYRLGRDCFAGSASAIGDEFVFTCALLHLAFITAFFGAPTSWEYYSYILVMGAAATSIGDAVSARVVALLGVLAVIGNSAHVSMALHAWRATAPAPQTRGLWASSEEREAWERVLATAGERRAVVITFQGSAAVLFRQFAPPIGAYLVPYQALPTEIQRTTDRLEHAAMAFAVTSSDYSAALAFYPKFRDMLNERQAVLSESADGITFTVYGARKPHVAGNSPPPIRVP